MGVDLQIGLSLLDGVDDLWKASSDSSSPARIVSASPSSSSCMRLMQSSVTCFTSEPTTSMEPAMMPMTSPE